MKRVRPGLYLQDDGGIVVQLAEFLCWLGHAPNEENMAAATEIIREHMAERGLAVVESDSGVPTSTLDRSVSN